MAKRNKILLVVVALAAAVVLVAILAPRPRPAATGPTDPAELLPDRCQAVFVVPDPGKLGEHLSILPRLKLADLLASLSGYPTADAVVTEFARQAGYDPRSRESMRAGGIDPSRPLLGYLSEKAVPLALIPVGDRAKFEERFTKGASSRLGQQKPQELKVGSDRSLFTLTGTGPSPQVVAWAHVGGYALVTSSAAGVELLKSVLTQPASASLARDSRFSATRTRLADRDLFAFSCLDAVPLQKQVFVPYGTTFAASLTERELRLTAELPLDDAWNEKLKSLAAPTGADLVSGLDPDAFLLARLGGDPALLAPLVSGLVPATFQRAFKEAGVDVVADVLGNLKPGVAGTLSLAPTARLGAVPELDVRRTNPFDYVRLAASGRALDEPKAARTLAAIAEVAPRFGARMEPTEVAGAKVFVTRYHLGEGASLALKGDRVLVTGGPGQMEAALGRLASPAPLSIADAAAARSLREDASALYLDLARLTAGVRTLPDSAYGVGGWAIKASVSRWLDAIDEISALRASARLADRTLGAELALTLKLPPAPVQAQAQPQAGQPQGARTTP